MLHLFFTPFVIRYAVAIAESPEMANARYDSA